ncbi:MAG: hypothetical protein PHQ22_10845 [Sulfuricurvum sp.]|nr:hypothetical protein [Sulfuricurvum sp.]
MSSELEEIQYRKDEGVNTIKESLDLIDSATNTAFETAQSMFFELDKLTSGTVERTTQGKLLVTVGQEIASIKILYNRIKNQIELLEELTKEEVNV